jgi:predicted oxidoreductase
MTASAPVLSQSPLGKSGLKVTPLAWGMWRFKGSDLTAARANVEAALDAGITFFDTADVYGPDNGEAFGAAEALLGRVLAEAPHLRERFVLATKGGIKPGIPYDSSDRYLTAALDASLRRMGVERVEMYQIHRPDTLTHPADLARTLDRMRQSGKVAEIGVSNFTSAQIEALQAYLPFPIACTQIELSPLAIGPIENGDLDQAMASGLGVMAWSPLGQGRLGAGAPADAKTAAVLAALDTLAAEHGVSRSVAVYAWLMAHPARPIPIIGSQQPARIAEAAQALKLNIDRKAWYAVLTAARGAPLP